MLQISDLSLSINGRKILNNVSLELKAGAILAMVGESGSGKTTLLRTIAGLEQPDEGRIIINGKAAVGPNVWLEPGKRGVGLVFQDFALFPHISVRSNILFGLSRLPKPEQQRRLDEMLALFQLQGLEGRYPHQLSGGQQQRVALARALAPKPDLLLLDEPFSGYDLLLRDSIRRELRELLDKAGTTVVLVTHDLTDALTMADEICIMQQGRILQQGTASQLMQHPVNDYVAQFMGSSNRLKVQLSEGGWISAFGPLRGFDLSGADEALIVFAPEAVKVVGPDQGDAFSARITRVMQHRDGLLAWCAPEASPEPVIAVRLEKAPDHPLRLALDYGKVHIFPLKSSVSSRP